MGGFVYVNIGLIVVVENEVELVGVIVYEIVYIVECYVVIRMRDVGFF